MWTEIIIPREDLAKLLAEALPLLIRVGDPAANHSLALTDLGDVTLVPDKGLRVECKAHVHWPLLGIDFPVEIRSLVLLVLPSIEKGEDGDQLVFRGTIEHADFAALPDMLDESVTAAINAKLSADGAKAAWNFSRSLAFLPRLPAMLEPLQAFGIRPAWAKIRITDEALVLAASFHTEIVRQGTSDSLGIAALARVPAEPSSSSPPPSSPNARRDASKQNPLMAAVTGAAFAFLAAGCYVAVRRAFS
jgi:hypothetical protein